MGPMNPIGKINWRGSPKNRPARFSDHGRPEAVAEQKCRFGPRQSVARSGMARRVPGPSRRPAAAASVRPGLDRRPVFAAGAP